MAFFLISLIGIPFTGGFFGKFYVFSAAIHSGMVWLAIIGLLNSGVAVFYYLRLLSAVYAKPQENTPMQAMPRVQYSLLVAIFLTVLATLTLGIFPGSVLGAARAAAVTLQLDPVPSAATTAQVPVTQ
jgi:NADH-quinone oxidoreductase subunit N